MMLNGIKWSMLSSEQKNGKCGNLVSGAFSELFGKDGLPMELEEIVGCVSDIEAASLWL